MIFWIIAVLLAFFVKGLAGFANTLVFTSVVGFAADNILISPVELLLGYPSNLIMAAKERKAIKWRLCLPLIALMAAGSAAGILFLKNANSGVIKLICAFSISAAGVLLFLQTFLQKKIEFSPILLKIVAIVSGILSGLYGIGVLLALYITSTAADAKSFRANICTVFFAENTFRIALYFATGILTLSALKMFLHLLPFMLIALFLGMKLGEKVSEKTSRRVVALLLVISGAALAVAATRLFM